MFKPKTDEAFLARRQTCLKFWRFTGPIMIVLIIALMFYLYLNVPWLVNPSVTITRVTERSFDLSTLEVIALIMPFLFNMVFVLLFAVVALTYVVMQNDKRYQKIIKNASREK